MESQFSDVLVVIPMFNEQTAIGDVIRDLQTVMPRILCVDDGSADDSAAVARTAGATVLRHPVNLGQGAALQTGFAYARRQSDVSFVVTFDADGQHHKHDAVQMVRRARTAGVDVVLGSRFLTADSNVPTARRMILKTAARFSRLTSGMALTDAHNGLRVLSRDALQQIDLQINGMAHASELLQRIGSSGLSYVEEPVDIRYTEYSRSKGQPTINAVNILFDLFLNRVRARS